MARTLKESFGNIGKAIADEYNDHGKARGISLEFVNGVFDLGDKVIGKVREYAPQAVDTAREQGAKVADAGREYVSKVSDAIREQTDDDEDHVSHDEATGDDDGSDHRKESISQAEGDLLIDNLRTQLESSNKDLEDTKERIEYLSNIADQTEDVRSELADSVSHSSSIKEHIAYLENSIQSVKNAIDDSHVGD